eukprot:TRINITY_DN10191_c0_g1_i1.p1 TRINITY_DN10191_c0_g1~~TRINITY_DN10191_c0_g1_i1.p1  ORF type:complete len:288 (-),score=100.85 TRINITY_DN10191_c0_g1_i1:434-1297(-)
MEEEFCPSSEIVFQQVYEDHDLGQVYDVTEEPTTSEHAFAFPHHQHQQVVSEQLQLQPSDIQDYGGGGGAGGGNVFTVDTSQPHVTEVRIESSDGGGVLLQPAPPSPSLLLLQEQQHQSSNEDLDMKWMYRKLKKDFFGAIETNECIKSELRHCQRVLQSVEEDKYFLTERLLLYQPGGGEQLLDNTSESESESDSETLVATAAAGGSTAPSSPDKSDRNPSGIIITSAFSRKRGFPIMEKKGRKKIRLDSPAYNMDSTNDEDGMMERLNDEDDDPSSPKENEEDSD